MYVGGSLSRADRRFEDWHAEGFERFGIFQVRWFRCPKCGLAFTPEHAAGVGVVDDQQASVCAEALGGCGFPWYGAATLAAYYEKHKTICMDTSGMVAIGKDSSRPAFQVFPYCPAGLVPADGEPVVVGVDSQQNKGHGDD